jgi:hypothetical protein
MDESSLVRPGCGVGIALVKEDVMGMGWPYSKEPVLGVLKEMDGGASLASVTRLYLTL